MIAVFNENIKLTVALLTDAVGTRVVRAWETDSSKPHYLYVAKDLLGKDGWIIDEPPEWIQFNRLSGGGAAELRSYKEPDVPRWIENALEKVEELRGEFGIQSRGYYEYALRRPLD